MKVIIATIIWVSGYAIVTSLLTGCAGMEVGGKLGVYRVDQRQESQATHHKPLPIKCYIWADCAGTEVTGADQGMIQDRK